MTTRPEADRSPHPLRWLPNALTVARLAALPVLAWLILTADGPTAPAAAWLFAIVALTDVVDGHLARRWNALTEFGRIADPFADRLLATVALVGLLVLERQPTVGPLAIIARDAALIVGFIVLTRRGRRPAVDSAGKASSGIVMVATGFSLLSTALWIDVLFWIGVAGSLLTWANYIATTLRGGWRETGVSEPSTRA